MIGGERMSKTMLWRTLVSVRGSQGENFDLVIPAWSPHRIIRVERWDLPRCLHRKLTQTRFYAYVNIGADDEGPLWIYGCDTERYGCGVEILESEDG